MPSILERLSSPIKNYRSKKESYQWGRDLLIRQYEEGLSESEVRELKKQATEQGMDRVAVAGGYLRNLIETLQDDLNIEN